MTKATRAQIKIQKTLEELVREIQALRAEIAYLLPKMQPKPKPKPHVKTNR